MLGFGLEDPPDEGHQIFDKDSGVTSRGSTAVQLASAKTHFCFLEEIRGDFNRHKEFIDLSISDHQHWKLKVSAGCKDRNWVGRCTKKKLITARATCVRYDQAG